ncbi:hypothetical protein IV79_GL001641 [Pediococcus claussenii]|nr:hypothetical protein IV79_GL001641 [Pediococcus claussenii]
MTGAVFIAQSLIVDTGKEMGFTEIGIPRYTIKKEAPEELDQLLDGMLGGFRDGDTLFLQTPTWNEHEFETALLDKVAKYKNSKVIIFIHDVIALMFKSNRYILPQLVEEYNRADVVIVPSENMRKYLIRNGLKVSKIIVQEVWDHIYNYPVNEKPPFKRQVSFIGNPNKFKFTSTWPYSDVRLRQYAGSMKKHNNNVDDIGFLPDQVLIPNLLMNGGFGLVWSTDSYWSDYMHVNTSHKIGTYLVAGLPIIIDENNSNAEMVRKNKLGFVVESLDEAIDLIKKTTEAEYSELRENVGKFAFLLRNGFFAKKLVTNAVFELLQNNISGETDDNVSINVLKREQTIEYLIKNKASIARFGSGEFNLINGAGISFQEYSEELAVRLRNILAVQSNSNFVLGVPDIFDGLDNLNEAAQKFWAGNLNKWEDFYNQMLTADWYGNSFMTRPYIDLKDKSQASAHFKNLKRLWDSQNILIVEGKNSRSGVGNDLFDNAKSIERIIVPSKNAFAKLSEIEQSIQSHGSDKLVLLMIGPTAKVVAHDLSKQGFWLIDMGHIDSEYEWFKMGAEKKVQISGKHTAEFNNDTDIHLEPNSKYDQQVIVDLS